MPIPMPMPMPNEYAETLGTVPVAWKDAADSWMSGIQQMFAQAPSLPLVSVEPTGVVDQLFDAGRRMLDLSFAVDLIEINRAYVHGLTSAAVSVGGAVRKHAEDVAGALRDQVAAAADVARGQVEGGAQLVQEQVQAVEQAVEEAAQEVRDAARQAQREARRQIREAEKAARAQAMEAYADLTKPALQAELARRDLPKSGTVDQLRERLIDADLLTAA